jgi:hypothetical protein
VTSALRIVCEEVILDRFPRDDIARVSPVSVEASIKLHGLFGRQWRFIAFLRDTFPQSLNKFYSLCERKALYRVHKIRTHERSLDGDGEEDKPIPR